MHVFHAAEFPLERGGENDDRNLRALLPQCRRYLCAELAGAKVIVEDGDVNIVYFALGVFDRRRRDGVIAMLPENGGTKEQVISVIIEQQDADGLSLSLLRVDRRSHVECWGES